MAFGFLELVAIAVVAVVTVGGIGVVVALSTSRRRDE